MKRMCMTWFGICTDIGAHDFLGQRKILELLKLDISSQYAAYIFCCTFPERRTRKVHPFIIRSSNYSKYSLDNVLSTFKTQMLIKH